MKSYLMISGACGGLGSAFVLDAARRGFDLFLTDRLVDGQRSADALAAQYSIDVVYQPCDLTNDAERDAFLRSLALSDTRFWGLINVAGLDNEGAFLERSREQILKILRLNILSTVDVTHAILHLRDTERRFRLVNVCSLAGFYPMPYKATYAASKRFLLDLSRALSEEIAQFGSVTALCPAGMPTTEACMRSMFAQGFWGLATSCSPERVATLTLSAALKGRRLVIPGLLNQVIRVLGGLVPTGISIPYVARRWSKARARQQAAMSTLQFRPASDTN